MSNLTEQTTTGNREFKGGDWVVLANSVSREPSLAQILKTDGRWPIIKWLDDNTESNVRLDFLRHATDEEIAAGRRIGNDMGDDMGDDTHIENHVSPLCLSDSRKNESQSPWSIKQDALSRMESCYVEQKKHVERLQTEVIRLNSVVERLKVENVVLQAKVDELQAENKMLHKAAATHLRNQKHYMDLYHRLIEQLYPYAIDLEDPVDGDVNIPKEYVDGYNRARECVHYNLLEMMESDIEYIRAQCDMLGGGGEA